MKIINHLCLFIFFCAHSTFIPAATNTWNGTTTNWNIASNWSSEVPGSEDDVIIPSGISHYPVLTAAATNDVKSITIQSGGNLTINDGGSLAIIGNITVNGRLTINGGTFILDNVYGTGNTNISGGCITANDIKSSGGTTNIKGGTINVHDFKPDGGTMNLWGGVLKISHDWKPNENGGTAEFNPAGGTVQFISEDLTF